MPGEATQVLAAFAASLKPGDLPQEVTESCKTLLLDTLACALAGHAGEETPQVAALASALARSDESSIIGGDRLSLVGATLLNSYLIAAATMCDAHRPTMCHVTPEVVPPALAIAERDGLCGRDLLVALAAGFEVTARVGLGLDYPAFRARGWHSPGIIGPFGAAAGAGRLRGFAADTMARAFGLAGSQAAGTFAAWGTPTVKFHQCRGAVSGLLAALLAEQKFAATREFLTAKDGGLYPTYANGGRPEAAIADLGRHWELRQIALRLWPSASLLQGMNTVLFDLIARHCIDFRQVGKVSIALSPTGFEMHGSRAECAGKFEAMISAHYTAAVIVKDRALTLQQFEPARYNEAALQLFAREQVAVRPDPELRGAQALVAIETREGAVYEGRCDHARGSPENPLSRAEIAQKFRTYAPTRLSEAAVEGVIDAVDRLEELASVRSLMDNLRAPRRSKRPKVSASG